MFDVGGIYTLGAQPGSIIAGNVLQNQMADYGAIYLDAGSRYFTLYDNVVFHNVRTASIKGGDHDFHDNWWEDVPPNTYYSNYEPYYTKSIIMNEVDQIAPTTFTNNYIIQRLSEVPSALISNAGLEDAYKDIKNEVIR
jgi:hypothetical protein